MTTEREWPPPQDLKTLIVEEHYRAAILRLRMGMDGCGCDECQSLYATLDLSAYGERVTRSDEFISIQAGKTGADLFDDSRDHWTDDGSIFVHFSTRWGLTPTGQRIRLGPVTTPPTSPQNDADTLLVGNVSKMPSPSEILSPADSPDADTVIMKQRGRPRKEDGEPISRATAWRRKKERENKGQGVLL